MPNVLSRVSFQLAGMVASGVNRYEFLIPEYTHGGLTGAQPELLSHELERHRVAALAILHVAVAVHLGPVRRFWPDGRPPPQEMALRLDEALQRSSAGRAVDPVSGRPENPLLQLPIGVR